MTKECLSVGSGAKTASVANWLYVDLLAWPIDVQADGRALPFGDDSFRAIQLSHVMEHVPLSDVPQFLSEMRRVLTRDGIFYVAVPDAAKARDIKSDLWSRISWSGGMIPGWEHRWQPSISKVRLLLEKAGFTPTWASTAPSGWPAKLHSWPIDLEIRFLCRRSDFGWPKYFPSGFSLII